MEIMETIESLTEENSEVQESDLEKPLNSPEGPISKLLDDDDLEVIEDKMNFSFRRCGWGHYTGEFARFVDNESEYLLKGTLRLIDKVVVQAENGEPYDTIFFLDKSARPGAYLYKEMVNVLRDKGYISEDLKLPEIKFMDVGKVREERKIKSDVTAGYMREKVKPEVLGHRVLIVDEFKDRGTTLSNAVDEFKDMYEDLIPDLYVDKVYQFNESGVATFWYRDSRSKSLVQDADITENLGGIDKAIKTGDESYLTNFKRGVYDRGGTKIGTEVVDLQTSLEELELLRSLASKVSRGVYIKLFDKSLDGCSLSDLEKIISESSPLVDVPEVKDELKAVLNSKIKVVFGSLYDYFEYAGGRLAAPYQGDRESGLKLREMLKELSNLFAERI